MLRLQLVTATLSYVHLTALRLLRLGPVLGYSVLGYSVLVYSLLGCSQTPAPAAPPKVCPVAQPVVTLAASERLNPTEAGDGLPVRVRLYQLSNDARLNGAAFDDLWQKETDTLGPELLQVEEHLLYPNQSQVVPVTLNPETRHLAFVALFRETRGRDWVVGYDVPPPGTEPCPETRKISLWLDGMRIQDGVGREPAPGVEPQAVTPAP